MRNDTDRYGTICPTVFQVFMIVKGYLRRLEKELQPYHVRLCADQSDCMARLLSRPGGPASPQLGTTLFRSVKQCIYPGHRGWEEFNSVLQIYNRWSLLEQKSVYLFTFAGPLLDSMCMLQEVADDLIGCTILNIYEGGANTVTFSPASGVTSAKAIMEWVIEVTDPNICSVALVGSNVLPAGANQPCDFVVTQFNSNLAPRPVTTSSKGKNVQITSASNSDEEEYIKVRRSDLKRLVG